MLADEVKKSSSEGLVALRDTLAATIEVAEPKEIAGLARQLQAVIAALDALPKPTEASPLDEIAAKRARRTGAPASDVQPAEGRKRGKRSG
jgi:hypothetical protein